MGSTGRSNNSKATFQTGLLQRWIPAFLLLLLAVLIAIILVGKIRREVWAYYTDDAGTRATADENKVRFVLWEDPRPHVFVEDREAEGARPGHDDANHAGGPFEAAFSPNGASMVLVRSEGDTADTDLYLSDWDGRLWSRPVPLTSLNTESNERSPSFSPDGRFLYFSSDRPGGQGGYDLFRARREGAAWTATESLGPPVNTPFDETGPALSADGSKLYFSSNRQAGNADDIFVASLRPGGAVGEDADDEPARFKEVRPVDALNSQGSDIQLALTARSNHVFLASDRQRSGQRGYRLYFSRVVQGVMQPPEGVDLYLEKGNVTDPAVRMEGFDLLFSSDHETPQAGADSNYRLYRTTTREVIGYTDLSRWEAFKDLLGDIKWWIVLALAAVLALIYLLESWRDITSLFHKCLAGSLAAHLLLLLAFMAMLIVKEIEKQDPAPPTEIMVSVDALAEEELALESAPEETEITEPDLSLPAQKVEANFDVPDFQPQDDARPAAVDAVFQQEAVEVPVRPVTSQPTEVAPLAQPAEPSALLTELSETVLPEPDQPVLDEPDLAETTEPAQPAEADYRPQDALPATAKRAEPSAVPDNPAPASAPDLPVAEATAEKAEPSPLTEVRPAEANESLPDVPETTPPLESELLADLPEAAPLDADQPELEEGSAVAADQDPGNPADHLFSPEGATAQGVAERAPNDAPPGSASASQAEVSEIAEGGIDVEPAASGPAQAVAEARTPSRLPQSNSVPSNLPKLPATALLETDAVLLEEGPAGTNARPADPANELLKPDPAAAGPASRQLSATASADQAVEDPADPALVTGAALPTQPPTPNPSQHVGEGRPDKAVSAPKLAANLPSNLEGPNLLDPSPSPLDLGTPSLEEGPKPNAASAPSEAERFAPRGAGSVANQAASDASNDSALPSAIETDAITGQTLAATDAAESASPRALEATVSSSRLPSAALQPAALTPSLGVALLPTELEAPESKKTTEFLKKQRGRPSLETIKQLGGSDGTERAIRASITWLANNQEEAGQWDARKHGAKGDFDAGVTGLALLCFYGWGARHDEDGEYRAHVAKALDWLLAQQQKDGDLGGGGLMYCHAIASIALCEAYGITKDARLREPAERAMAYTLAAQSKSKGGWRYNPGEDSDTSITGWQYMALHSAQLAGLSIPDEAFARAERWLDRVGGGKHGGLYGYQAPARNSPAMVATGMFCRQLDLLPPTHPKQIESAGFLQAHPMKSRNQDHYYIYYATLALYQHQGAVWDAWNARLKETLPATQRQTGSLAGSWDLSRGLTANGGRVASTTLATLSLEVYYRILPIYGFRGEDESVPEAKKKESPSNRE